MDKLDLAAWALLVFLAKEIYSFFNNKNDKLQDAINELAIAIGELRMHFDFLAKSLEELPDLRKDIQEAHNRLNKLIDNNFKP